MINEIQKHRDRAGLSQGQLAEKLGWRPNRLSNYERGERDPGLEECRAIVGALSEHLDGITIDDVFPQAQSAA